MRASDPDFQRFGALNRKQLNKTRDGGYAYDFDARPGDHGADVTLDK
jgi:hypothetical protein